MACTKHYIANEQEHFRQGGPNITESLSANVGDVTMHELYLWPFADAVRAGTAAIMCSYNQVNNSYACQNSYLQNYLLKNELGFQGFVLRYGLLCKAGGSIEADQIDSAIGPHSILALAVPSLVSI